VAGEQLQYVSALRCPMALVPRYWCFLLLLTPACEGSQEPAPPPPPVAIMEVLPGAPTVAPGSSFQLQAVARNFFAAGWTWNVSDNARASVSNTGLLRAIAVGSVVVQACATNLPAICGSTVVTIIELPPNIGPAFVIVTPSQLTLSAGTHFQFSVSGLNGPTGPWTWSVGNPAVALISVAGELTALAAGSTTVMVCSSVTPVCGTAELQVH
jgi:hypothetical protein